MTWTRQGECNGCGYCCQHLGPEAVEIRRPAHGAPLDAAFFALRGAAVATADRAVLLIHAFLPCQAHDAAGKRCTMYDARPASCRDFPRVPEQIEDTPCSFYFERGAERRGGQGSPYPTPTQLKPGP